MFGSTSSRPSSGNNSGTLNNRYQSYQQGPPSVASGTSTTYADQQTNVLQDTVKTHYAAEGTAATVLSQLHTQRHQLKGAHDDVWEMRMTTEKARKELADLAAKNRQKRQRLYAWIGILGLTDLLLFWRLLRCHGSFFC